MKKLGIFIILFITLFSLGSVSAWEYDNHEDSGGLAFAYVFVEGYYPVCDGFSYEGGNICVGDYVIKNLKWFGDKYYIEFSPSYWATSSENGYTGQNLKSARCNENHMTCTSDSITLDTKNGHPVGYVIYAWVYEEGIDDSWAWTGQGGGYLIDTFNELKVVECYQDSNCESDEFCDKRGDFKDWECRRESVCDDGDEKCDGLKLQKCISYGDYSDWFTYTDLEVGVCGVECLESETKCDEKDYLICENNKFIDKGEIIGKCGVEEQIEEVLEEEIIEEEIPGETEQQQVNKIDPIIYLLGGIGVIFIIFLILLFTIKKKK